MFYGPLSADDTPLSENRPVLTPLEMVIFRTMKRRPGGWDRDQLIDELSRGLREPMTTNNLTVRFHLMRKKGIDIRYRLFYCLMGADWDTPPVAYLPGGMAYRER